MFKNEYFDEIIKVNNKWKNEEENKLKNEENNVLYNNIINIIMNSNIPHIFIYIPDSLVKEYSQTAEIEQLRKEINSQRKEIKVLKTSKKKILKMKK